MPSHSQRHRTRTLPFPYLDEGLDFDLEAFATDEGDFQPTNLKPGQREFDLTSFGNADSEWETATLRATLTLPEHVVEEVLAEDERAAPPAKLYVAIRCHETIFRDRIDVQSNPVKPGTYDVTVDLDRRNYKGEIELRPYLVRNSSREDATGYATTRNVRLASDLPHRIVIDRPDEDRPPMIDGQAASFGQTSHLPDGEQLYYLDFRNEAQPKLWLNADYPRVTNVLESRGAIGAEPRMRDVVLDEISYGIWTQLIVHATTAIDGDGNVEYQWQENVLETFGRALTGRSNLETAKQELRDTVSDPNSLAQFMSRVDAEIQEFLEPRQQLINLMEEGLKI